MKKWKRCIAVALAFIIFCTSTSLSNAAGYYDKKYNVWNSNAAEVVGETYNLSENELDILYNSAINSGTRYRYYGPYENRTGSKRDLLAVDYANKVVYAKYYSKSNYIWIPTKAVLTAGGEVVETLNLAQGYTYYDGNEYNASQAFTYDGNKYRVELIYELSVNISEEEQMRILEIPGILAQTANNIAIQLTNLRYDAEKLGEMTVALKQLLEVQFEKEEVVVRSVNEEPANSENNEIIITEDSSAEGEEGSIPEIIEFGAPVAETVSEKVITQQPALDPVEHADEIAAIEALYKEYTENDGLILYNLSEKYLAGDGNVLEFADNYGVKIQKSSEVLFGYIDTLKTSNRLGMVINKLAETDVEFYAKLQNYRSTLTGLIGSEKKPGPVRVLQNVENWKFIDSEVRPSVIKSSHTKEAYAALESAAYALRKEKLGVPAVESETLKAAEVSISCDISICKVTVTVSGTVASGEIDQEEYITMEPATKRLVILEGSTEQQVLDAIDNCGLEAEMLSKWNALDPDYQISIVNYDREETKLPDKLREDIDDYQIVYTPKMYKINTNFRGNEKLPYGFKMEFPRSTDEKISYDYMLETADGTKISYDEGAVYKVTKSVDITQLEGAEKTEHRLYEYLIQDVQYEDIFTDKAKEILRSSAVESPVLNIRVPNKETVNDVVFENGVYSITAENYASGIYGMSWEPDAVKVYDGAVLKSRIPFVDGVASWTDSLFTHVTVDYKLKIKKVKNSFLSNRELDEREDVLYALNLPYELVNTVVAEQEYLDGTEKSSVKKVFDQLNGSTYQTLLNKNTLNLVSKTYLTTQKGKNAVAHLLKDEVDGGAWNYNIVENENGELALFTYMKKCNDAEWKLAPYYREGYYKDIPKQAGIVADCLEDIIADPGAKKQLESYMSKINSLISHLRILSAERPGPHKAMIINDSDFPTLIENLLKMNGQVSKVDSSKGIYAYSSVQKNGEKTGSISISVRVGSRVSEIRELTYELENGVHMLTADEEEQIRTHIAELEASLWLTEEEKTYYDHIETAIPKAEDIVGKNMVVSLVYTPKTYTVDFAGMKKDYVASFKYNSDYLIKLPAYSENVDETNYYCYIIDGIEVRVNNGDYKYFEFDKTDLTELFGSNQHYQAQVVIKQTYSQWDVKPVVEEDGDVIKDSYLDFDNKLLYLEVNPWGIDEETFEDCIAFENGLGEEKGYRIFNYNRAGGKEVATGAIVECYSENEEDEAVVTEYTIILMGDVNKDGQVTLADLKMLKDNYIGIASGEDRILDDPTKLAADMNGNGKAYDSNDALLMSRKYNYWIPVDDVEYKSVLE